MSSPRPPGRQLPLDFAPATALGRDDLVVTASNAAAIGIVDRWPDWPAPVVVLCGPAGSGKSHLASVWRAASGASRLPLPISAEEAIEVAAQGPVLIDDVDTPPLDEEGLFHLVNAVRGAGTQLLLTSRRLPASWGMRLPDLASRLKAATIVDILPPDEELLAAVITKLFADRQVEVEPHVVQYVVRRIERSLSTAMDVVDRLDKAALERKSRISRALAADIVTSLDAGQAGLDFEG